MKKSTKEKKREPHWYETPFEFLGWIDSQECFHPANDGNRYIYSASAYDWRRVWGVSKP